MKKSSAILLTFCLISTHFAAGHAIEGKTSDKKSAYGNKNEKKKPINKNQNSITWFYSIQKIANENHEE